MTSQIEDLDRSQSRGMLAEKVAIVIGAGRGIGSAIATRFGLEQAIVVVADRDLALAEATARQINKTGHAIAVETDIGSADAAAQLVETTVARFGRLDILVQNAAIYPWNLIPDISADEWDSVLTVNLRSAFLSAKAALAPMRDNGGGRLIFISSITGPRVSSPGHAHYSASKAGINGFIRTAALEYSPYNITVNAVEPGNILTEGMKAERTQEFIDGMQDSVPLGRLGTPEEVASAVNYLASDEAGYITGTSIIVDGGQILPETMNFRV